MPDRIPRALVQNATTTKLRTFHLTFFGIALLATFLYSTWAVSSRNISYFHQGKLVHALRRDQGVLAVGDAEGLQHPIALLIARSERLWKDKLARQSTTLEQAYREYIRRYGRQPPKGFDIWYVQCAGVQNTCTSLTGRGFKWCQDHNVQLLDEYDQLDKDLKLFWAVSPADLNAAQEKLEHHVDSYTIGKNKATDDVTLLTHNMTAGRLESAGKVRAQHQIDLIATFKKELPPFHATWSLHDAAQMFISWEMREAAEAALAAGTFMNASTIKSSSVGWASACQPGTPLNPVNKAERWKPDPRKSFISDHRASMDPCYTPELAWLSTLGDYPQGIPTADNLYPALARAKTMMHSDILGTTTEGWTNERDDVPWSQKQEPRMLWRGRTTGREFAKEYKEWQTGQRFRLVEVTNRQSGKETVLPPPDSVTGVMGKPKTWSTKELNKRFFDTGIVEAVQCPPHICDNIKQDYAFKGWIDGKTEKHYKYLVDADGNSWSSRFRRLMARDSLVLKSTVYPEWWTDRAVPWVHYVPIKLDFSDLYDTMAFFTGLPDGTPGRDELAEKIASAGRDWVGEFYRYEDLVAYTWRVYLEFTRVTSMDRESLDFTLASVAGEL